MTNSITNANTPVPSESNSSKRNQQLLILMITVVTGIGIYLAYYFLYARYYQVTDDAYVASDLVQITSEISGTVHAINVDDTQYVQRGDVLLLLDRTDAEIELAAAEASLASTVRDVIGLFSRSKALHASIRANQVSLDRAHKDLQRRLSVSDEGGVSDEELQHAHFQVAQFEAALAASQAELAINNAQIENTCVANHPQVLAAAAKVREAALNLKRTEVLAPVSGVIARRRVQIGSRIRESDALMVVVPLENVWVDANFKEGQLAQMRVGQPVEVTSDFYGDDVVYHGEIAGMAAGSGAAFALLPPQNASGNWIKIVQRVPVRVTLSAEELLNHPLRVGLSMQVRVDVHNTNGSVMATQVRAKPQQLNVNNAHQNEIEQGIANIISYNSVNNSGRDTAISSCNNEHKLSFSNN